MLAGVALFLFSACRQASAPKNDAEGFRKETFLNEADAREPAQKDEPIPQADVAAQCRAWESRYGTEAALPVELFADLQRYVAEGKCASAPSDYRQEELLCTAEELAKACPDHEALLKEYFAGARGENVLQADKVYRLEEADGSVCFLLFYLHRAEPGDAGFLSTMTLKREGEEWRLTGSAAEMGGVRDYEVFAREEGGKRVYYFLNTYDSSTWMELSRLSESRHVPLDGWKIGLIQTGVRPEVTFQAAESALAVRAREYVEENACFLAWMQQNGKPIWGDEGKGTRDAMREAALETDGTGQVWVIDFEEAGQIGTVTFRMNGTEDGSLLLEARAGGADGTLLLSAELTFMCEAGVSGVTPAYWEALGFNGRMARKTEKPAWDEVWERTLRERQQRSIVPWQGEKGFPDAVFDLLREEARTGLRGESNALLERCRMDLTADTERFLQLVPDQGKGNVFGSSGREGECKWAYRWFGEDGSENFLSCINYRYAKDSIQWWKVTEGGLEEHAYVTESYEPSQVIRCDGQVYWINEAVPDGRGGSVWADAMEVGNGEKWRTACFSISANPVEEGDFACIPLYEAEGLSPAVRDYVQGRWGEVVSACRSVNLISGTGEGQEPTAGAERMLDSLSDGSRGRSANHHYFTADVDNDGRMEYGAAQYSGGLDVTFYELEEGAFRVIPFQEVLPEREDADGLPAEALTLRQLWCEKLGDVTYLFTVEEVADSPDFLLRIRVFGDDRVEGKAAYLLRGNMAEDYREGDLEITPSAEGVG